MIVHLARLDQAIKAAGVAIDGIDSTGIVTPASLQTAAQPTINAFDDSQAAQDAWEDAKEPLLASLRDQIAGAIADNDAFLAITSPTNAQLAAQVKKLTQHDTGELKALGRMIQKIWR